LSFARLGKNDLSSLAFSFNWGRDLNKLSLGELRSDVVGDCQLAISFACFSARRFAAINSCLHAADLAPRDLIATGASLGAAAKVTPGVEAGSGLVAAFGTSEPAGTFAKAVAGEVRCEYFVQIASVANAQTSKAVATANERLKARRG